MRFFFFLFSQFVELTYSSKNSIAALCSGKKGGGARYVQIKHKYKTINNYKTVGVLSRWGKRKKAKDRDSSRHSCRRLLGKELNENKTKVTEYTAADRVAFARLRQDH